MDGKYFRIFLEQEGLNKTKFAEDHSLSRTGLYNLFKTKKFSAETITWIEKIFRKRWDEIKAAVNIDVSHEIQLPDKSKAYDALFSVLISEIAALKAKQTGVHQYVIEQQLRKAAEDALRLG